MEDKTNLCSLWMRNGACELDRDFTISDDEEDPWNINPPQETFAPHCPKTLPFSRSWLAKVQAVLRNAAEPWEEVKQAKL